MRYLNQTCYSCWKYDAGGPRYLPLARECPQIAVIFQNPLVNIKFYNIFDLKEGFAI